MTQQVDCRQATAKICSVTLGKTDYQLGQTKVFLKDAQDLFLEQERDRVLTKKLIIIQRCIRGWIHRRRYLRLRAAAIVIQRQWRRQAQRKRYLEMRSGFLRLQALIRSRILSHRFQHLRGHIVGLQARCRGYLIRRQLRVKTRAVVILQSHVRRMIAQRRYKNMRNEKQHLLKALQLRNMEERELKKAGNKRYKEIAEQHYRVCHCNFGEWIEFKSDDNCCFLQERLLEMEREQREKERANMEKLKCKLQLVENAANQQEEAVEIDDLFDFLKTESGGEAPPPSAFRVMTLFDINSFSTSLKSTDEK